MSRTYRRKNYEDTQGCSWSRKGRKINGYYTEYEYHSCWEDGEYYWWYEYRPMTKEEAVWQWLRDHGETNSNWARDNPGVWLRRNLQKRQRQKARQEIIKFLKHEEYEPIIESRRDKSWWYWL